MSQPTGRNCPRNLDHDDAAAPLPRDAGGQPVDVVQNVGGALDRAMGRAKGLDRIASR